MEVIKRSGAVENLTYRKIYNSIQRANSEVVESAKLPNETIESISNAVIDGCARLNRQINVLEVEEMVGRQIFAHAGFEVGKKYLTYRYEKERKSRKNTTDDSILSLLKHTNAEIDAENANKNPILNSTQRDYMAGEVSKDITRRYLLPKDIVEAHDEGIIHFHDADYFANSSHNCDLYNLEDMLQNGTVISGVKIDKPKTFSTACNLTCQICAQLASQQYGGQTFTLTHLAPFVQLSREKFTREVRQEMVANGITATEAQIENIVKSRLADEIKKGVQTIQYQILTLMTTNGQAPFVSVCMYLGETDDPQTKADLALVIEEFLKQRIQGIKNEVGAWIAPTFPKLLYMLEEDNIRKDSKYWYLTELAAKCVTKRMVPDFISEKVMKKLKIDKNGNGHCYPCMGCRSFLTPYLDNTGKPKFYGRFNQGVVTINLPDIALTSKKDMNEFWRIFDERLDLCHRALRIRHEHLLGTKSDVAPILWQHGALARLKPGETIDKLLYGGYSTISLGYVGLYECVKYMTGYSHTDEHGVGFAKKVMQHLNDACKKWKAAENIDYSLYGTPEESTTYKFAKALQRRFGLIEGITDKNYVTNSYHVPVFEQIDAFTKISKEADFQALSPGGAISYIETPNMENNVEAILTVMQYIYENIMYCEINTRLCVCQVCGGTGTVDMVKDENGFLKWKCTSCGNDDHTKINAVVRLCGYLGNANTVNQGRMADIYDRVYHL